VITSFGTETFGTELYVCYAPDRCLQLQIPCDLLSLYTTRDERMVSGSAEHVTPTGQLHVLGPLVVGRKQGREPLRQFPLGSAPAQQRRTGFLRSCALPTGADGSEPTPSPHSSYTERRILSSKDIDADPINPLLIGSDCKPVASRLVFLARYGNPLFPRLKSAECHLVSRTRIGRAWAIRSQEAMRNEATRWSRLLGLLSRTCTRNEALLDVKKE
jgi:hypothetical protein